MTNQQLLDKLNDIRICLRIAKKKEKFSEDAFDEAFYEVEKLLLGLKSNNSTDESL